MSSFFKIFFSAVICLNLYIAAIAQNSPVSETSPENIELLIRKLSSASFAERDNATKELIHLGYYARPIVKKALNSKDPEAKMRLKDIWKRIQWIIFPGAGEDVNHFITKLESEGDQSSEQWDKITKKYSPEIMLMFLHLNKQPEFSKHIRKGLLSLLNNSDAEKIAAYIKQSPDKETLIELLLSLNKGRLNIPDSRKLQSILISLELKEESVMTASSSWRMGEQSDIPQEVLSLFGDPAFAEKVFIMAAEQLNGSETSMINDWKICFFAKIAKDINRKELIENLLKDLDYNIKDNSSIIYLSEVLISISSYSEAIDVLSGTHTNISIYLRSVAYNNSGDKDTAEKLMDLLYTKLKSKWEYYLIGEEMNKFKDPRAVKLWERILEMGPHHSVYDSTARFRLGNYYETKGEYGKAADLLEKGVDKNEGFQWLYDQGLVKQGEEVAKSLKNHISNLREQEKGGAQIWFNAVKAMNNKKNAEALEGFRKFIDKNPEYIRTYFNITLILESQRKLEEAISCIEKGSKYIKKDDTSTRIEFLLKKIFLLSMQKKYDKAITELEKAVDLDPENSDILSMLAMNTYYTKDYKKSAELFARNYAMDAEDLYTQLWIYISLRKINKDPNPVFANFAKKIDGNEWPVPIIKYYGGLITLEKCLKATNDINKKRENEKKCEAYYFIGEFMLLNNQKKDAIEYFNKCIKCNIPDFREHLSSLQRLKELQ